MKAHIFHLTCTGKAMFSRELQNSFFFTGNKDKNYIIFFLIWEFFSSNFTNIPHWKLQGQIICFMYLSCQFYFLKKNITPSPKVKLSLPNIESRFPFRYIWENNNIRLTRKWFTPSILMTLHVHLFAFFSLLP
jgi:hypothetical protein